MKALSIQQPWAWLIAHADEYDDPKRIENRNWATRYRGPLLIHASKTFDRSGYESVLEVRPDLESVMPVAGAMERVDVIDCVVQSPSR
ncbi:ASCH domain-containing protein [Burkholderia contaminans]|uniref:ASCH domain-containing protein n=1 Tax=Burkholderia contaminans TaxID=488447 RepID=UPI0015E37541|nr:ASCH domain-containing protein [Burkholderia contaminans]